MICIIIRLITLLFNFVYGLCMLNNKLLSQFSSKIIISEIAYNKLKLINFLHQSSGNYLYILNTFNGLVT